MPTWTGSSFKKESPSLSEGGEAGPNRLFLCFRNWKLVFDDGQAPRTYYNEDNVAVPAGAYKVIVSDGTTNFGLDLKIRDGETWEYNFADNKLEKKPAPASATEDGGSE